MADAPSALVIVFVAPAPPGSSEIATPSVRSSPHVWNAVSDSSPFNREIRLSVTHARDVDTCPCNGGRSRRMRFEPVDSSS
jgi:hypothetical protein